MSKSTEPYLTKETIVGMILSRVNVREFNALQRESFVMILTLMVAPFMIVTSFMLLNL